LLEGNNIPESIRQRFLEIGRLVKDKDPYLAWRPKEGQIIEVDKAAAQKLEDEVVEEMAVRRRDAA
jgi:hypothetical protein